MALSEDEKKAFIKKEIETNYSDYGATCWKYKNAFKDEVVKFLNKWGTSEWNEVKAGARYLAYILPQWSDYYKVGTGAAVNPKVKPCDVVALKGFPEEDNIVSMWSIGQEYRANTQVLKNNMMFTDAKWENADTTNWNNLWHDFNNAIANNLDRKKIKEINDKINAALAKAEQPKSSSSSKADVKKDKEKEQTETTELKVLTEEELKIADEVNAKKEEVDQAKKESVAQAMASIESQNPGALTAASFHKAWDLRLRRLDEFLYKSSNSVDKASAIRIPFATDTVATTFADQVFTVEKSVALQMYAESLKKNGGYGMEDYDIAHIGLPLDYVTKYAEAFLANTEAYNTAKKPWDDANEAVTKINAKIAAEEAKESPDSAALAKYRAELKTAQANLSAASQNVPTKMPNESTMSDMASGWTNEKAKAFAMMPDQAKVMMNGTKEFSTDKNNYAPLSVMNPFALTRLVGGLSSVTEQSAFNYMYDIRDRRRFYDLATKNTAGLNDNLTVFNPSVTNIISWANSDRWGRTPYSFLDFVYSKWYSIIPNNRLITLRRYTVPTFDNLSFEFMYGPAETVGKNPDGTNDPATAKVLPKNADGQGQFAPICTVVTYGGGDTGNDIASMLGFTSGLNWESKESDIYGVSGDDGTDPLQVIDQMFEQGGFGGAENGFFNKMLGGLSTVSGKIMSFGKFALNTRGHFQQSEAVLNKTYNAQSDPYSDGPFQNKIVGPVNRIQSVMRRKAGITFELNFTVKATYVSRGLGGMNPKAELLDCLGNAMAMVSPKAVFWGGGHKYNITPHCYPFHDGGWRDSFMKKIYEGKFLGKDGAVAAVGGGLKQMLSDAAGGDNPDDIMGNLGGVLKQGGSLIMGAIAGGMEALSSAVGVGGLGDMLSSAANFLTGGEKKTANQKASSAIKNVFNVSTKMWHDKCLLATTFPEIHGMAALLTGEPVGEWHLTIGNPLNPMAVIGNLICKDVKLEWGKEIGPDDFFTEFTVTYTLEHGMPRDREGIQSMFNRGMGKIYSLPDYIKMSSDMETSVDAFTGGSDGATGELKWMNARAIKKLAASDGYATSGKNVTSVDAGHPLPNSGSADTTLITKFTPPNTNANRSLAEIRSKTYISNLNMSMIKSLAANRKSTES